MKKHLIIILIALVFGSPAFGEKPEWVGKVKPTAKQKKANSAMMEAKEGLEQELYKNRENFKKQKIKKEKKIKKEHDKLKGLEKQKVKKSEQIQKELKQGSEKGKEARQGSKKWWKFWGE